MSSIIFGPVPSRRLGRSMGINNILPKICSYSCVYCQLGKTLDLRQEREVFYFAERIVQEVKDKVSQVREKDEQIDYLSFVPDGEATLDINLGKEIELLKPLGIKIAVITNASLLYREDTRQDLQKADWVSLKVDTVSERIWHKINRPAKTLELGKILQGMLQFAAIFRGELTTETMLIQGINDDWEEIRRTASFLAQLKPRKAYVAIPTRPPAEKWVMPAGEPVITAAHQIFTDKLSHVEYLIGYEGNDFALTDNVEDDLLSILAVHPMREEAIKELLRKADAGWETVERLLNSHHLIEVDYAGRKFYMRRIYHGSSHNYAQ